MYIETHPRSGRDTAHTDTQLHRLLVLHRRTASKMPSGERKHGAYHVASESTPVALFDTLLSKASVALFAIWHAAFNIQKQRLSVDSNDTLLSKAAVALFGTPFSKAAVDSNHTLTLESSGCVIVHAADVVQP
eukprot:2744073-Prymnesium_polylepis.1